MSPSATVMSEAVNSHDCVAFLCCFVNLMVGVLTARVVSLTVIISVRISHVLEYVPKDPFAIVPLNSRTHCCHAPKVHRFRVISCKSALYTHPHHIVVGINHAGNISTKIALL